MAGTMIIDGQKVDYTNEKNVLDVVRRAGIELPTFCYHSELSIYGACRMCMVQDQWGGTFASCSAVPKDGMEIWTNTAKLKRYRRMNLELILANHDRDCTVCEKSGRCRLQELAVRFGVRQVRFAQEKKDVEIDDTSEAIVRNPNKCILCGDCVRMCEEVQGVGVLGFAHRGSNIRVTTAFGRAMSDVDCVSCGQCRTVCPTGALIIKKSIDRAWEALHDPARRVVAQIAPAVRVALGEEFGLAPGEVTTGKIAAALRRMGFEQVYDTSLAADLTVTEESQEFLAHWRQGTGMPLFTSCCPAWMRFAEQRYPELLAHISTCRSPQQMLGAVVRETTKADERRTVMISVMPCTAKKYEIGRPENSVDGRRDVELVLTTQELAMMMQEYGIDFAGLEPEALDMPFGLASGAGVLFGVSGGVAESVLRYLNAGQPLKDLSAAGTRGTEGIRYAQTEVDGQPVTIAVVHGLKRADELVRAILAGERKVDFVEVMACPGGCVGGAGQPIPQSDETKRRRGRGIYGVDNASLIKRSGENPAVLSLYEGLLRNNRAILHRVAHADHSENP